MGSTFSALAEVFLERPRACREAASVDSQAPFRLRNGFGAPLFCASLFVVAPLLFLRRACVDAAMEWCKWCP